MLDAKQVLILIRNKWSISPPVTNGNYIVNSGFEEDFTGWNIEDSTATITTLEHHTGNKACKLTFPPFGWSRIRQLMSLAVSVDNITKFGFWYKGDLGDSLCNQTSRIFYVEGGTTSFLIGSASDWIYYNLLPILEHGGRHVSDIYIEEGSTGPIGYIDDVVLEATGELYLALDEFNPNYPKYQLVFINRPTKTIFLSPNVFKVEQDIQIELHTKLIRYEPDTVSSIRDIFTNIKAEVKRILNVYRFDNVGSILNMSGWIDDRLPHGYGEQREPLELVSRLTLQIIYYNTEDNTLIGTRVKQVNILNNDLLGVIDIDFEDTNPWVRIEIPKGPIIEQNLIGPHVNGEITTHDYSSLYTCLYNTEITENPSHYPINSDNSKTKFSTEEGNPEFIIVLTDNKGTDTTFYFYNVRIKTVKLEKTPTSGLKEAVWMISWMADKVTTETPNGE